MSAVVSHIHIHRTHFFTFSAGNTPVFIAFDPYYGKITHGLQEYSNRAYIFTKCPVIFKEQCQHDTDCIIQTVSDNKSPEHDSFNVSDFTKK